MNMIVKRFDISGVLVKLMIMFQNLVDIVVVSDVILHVWDDVVNGMIRENVI